MQYFSILDVAILVGISRDRIEYQEDMGRLPRAQRWHGRKVYDQAAVETIREFFDKTPKFMKHPK